jgi:4-hydroxybenzoate polyprenyltransferase
MTTFKKYLSLIKFSHTIFAMPFAMIGFALGWVYKKREMAAVENSMPESKSMLVLFILVVLCMVFARSAAMAFNRYLDRHFDAQNQRTAIREIPSGKIKANHALLFTIISSAFFVCCTLLINTLCFYLSFVALFVILFYSYTKRFTALCHLVLGLGLSLAPIGAFLAVTGVFHWVPVLFSVAVMFWVSGFDIIYAMQDEAFDRSLQLHSIPVKLGKKNALNLSILLHILCGGLIISAGILAGFGLWYWLGAGLFCTMLFYQHTLVKPNDLSKVNIAFMTANGIASVLFAFFVIADILSHVNQMQ